MNEFFMEQAIKLALKGKDKVYPNPMVGCVIVKEGKIIARGWHKYFGAPHAEIEALAQINNKAQGCDLYVTLEPCNSYGKRPPCTQAIIAAGIKRVFFAVEDPSVSHAVETLKSAGIEVFSGLCKTRAKLLLKDFLAHLKLKPKVCIKAAMSLDGKIATKTFDSKWISSLKSRKTVHEMRSHFDAVLIGKNTALKDNPILSSHGAGRNPARVVVDFDLSLPKNYHLLDGTIPTFFVCSQKIKNIPDYYKGINKNLVFVDEAAAKKDFNVIIKKLNLLNIKTILIEGGGEIIYSALFSHAVDECFFFVAPIILGGKNAVSVAGGLGADKVKEAVKFKDIKVSKIGGDILIKAKAEKKCSLE